MEIISHRGYWLDASEKNALSAFERSFSLGYGTETDVRDCQGRLVISHDIPTGKEISFDDMLAIYNKHKCSGTLAINIKADGLQDLLLASLNEFNVKNYFIFDSSIPDSLVSMRKGLNTFLRFSEYEQPNSLWKNCNGIWFDKFNSDNSFDLDIISRLVSDNMTVSIVSEELHGRDSRNLWNAIYQLGENITKSDNLILCTDIPEEAKGYFYGA